MIFFVILGFLSPIIFGYTIYTLLLDNRKFIEMISFSFGFGFGCINLIMVVENYFFGIKFSFFNSLLIATFLLALSCILIWVRKGRFIDDLVMHKHRLSKVKKLKPTHLEIFLLLLILCLFSIIFYKAVFFPIYYCDAVGAHANIPKQIFLSKTLPTQIGSFSDNFNASPNLLYTQAAWFYFLNGGINDVLLRILIPIYSVLVLLLTYDIGTRLIKYKYGGMISVVFLLFVARFTFFSMSSGLDA